MKFNLKQLKEQYETKKSNTNSEEQLIEYVKDKQLEYAIEIKIATLDDKKYITC